MLAAAAALAALLAAHRMPQVPLASVEIAGKSPPTDNSDVEYLPARFDEGSLLIVPQPGQFGLEYGE